MSKPALEWAGLILAAVTVISIAIGHILVRRLYARFGTRPAIAFFGLGALLLAGSFAAQNNLFSGILGLVAITLVWDGIEMYRQQKRMQREGGTS